MPSSSANRAVCEQGARLPRDRHDRGVSKRKPRRGDPRIAVGYIRVSTEDQNLGPEAQRAAIEAWARRHGAELVAICEDLGVSGATPLELRSGLAAAIEAVRSSGAGVLLAAKRDRFARDVVIAAMVERAALAAGAVTRTTDGSSDAEGPEGGMMRGIVDVFAQYEREVIRARTRAALGVKKARGERVGTIPFGYRLAEDGIHLEEDPIEQSTIALVLELREARHTFRAIVTELRERGVVARRGHPLGLSQVARILEARRGPPSSRRARRRELMAPNPGDAPASSR